MPVLEFKITVPEGTTVNIVGLENALAQAAEEQEDSVECYWRHYLSNNTRKLLNAAAQWEHINGPGFTLEDIAKKLSIDYESVRSYKQTLGRPASRWRKDTGTPEPIRLQWQEYKGADQGMRTVYYLPEGMADTIRNLAASYMVGEPTLVSNS